jgi:RND family efflux transporter MFP subunit
MMETDAAAAAARLRSFGRIAVAVLVVAVLLTAWGVLGRLRAAGALRAATAELATIQVYVTQPTPAAGPGKLQLPGDVLAETEAAVHARVSGYLRRRLVDIGQNVRAGQLLAVIDAPELDAQLRQAAADLASVVTAERLAHSTAERWRALFAQGMVSRQDADDRDADAAAKRAALEAAQANLARLQEQAGFERVVAPFDGVITARHTDVGALVDAGSGSGPELFHLAATRRLRVQVHVPESSASDVRIGAAGTITPRDRPGAGYAAKVARSARALDPVSRTLLAELEVDNRDGTLLPGGLADVSIDLAGGNGVLRLPAGALQFGAEGARVAVVGADGRVTMRPVTLGRDLGREVEVLAGVAADDRVILDPPDSLADGDTVRALVPASTAPRDKRL